VSAKPNSSKRRVAMRRAETSPLEGCPALRRRRPVRELFERARGRFRARPPCFVHGDDHRIVARADQFGQGASSPFNHWRARDRVASKVTRLDRANATSAGWRRLGQAPRQDHRCRAPATEAIPRETRCDRPLSRGAPPTKHSSVPEPSSFLSHSRRVPWMRGARERPAVSCRHPFRVTAT